MIKFEAKFSRLSVVVIKHLLVLVLVRFGPDMVEAAGPQYQDHCKVEVEHRRNWLGWTLFCAVGAFDQC